MSFFNQLTKPFGIKLFGGSDYSDNGMGDRALADQEKANSIFNSQGQYGNQLVQQSAPNLQDYGTNEAPLQGEAAKLPGELSNFATYSNIAGPGVSAGDPYKLLPYEQQQYNNQQDTINKLNQQSAGRLKAELGRKGIKEGDPAYSAAMQQLEEHHGGTLSGHQADFMESSRQRRATAAQQLAGMQQSLAGFQHQTSQDRFGNTLQTAGLGNNMLNSATSGYQNSASLKNNIGQQARQENAATGQFWQGLAGFGLGGGFGGGGSTGNVFGAGGVFGSKAPSTTTSSSGASYPYGAYNPPQEQAQSSGTSPFALPPDNTNIFSPTRKEHSFKTGFGAF